MFLYSASYINQDKIYRTLILTQGNDPVKVLERFRESVPNDTEQIKLKLKYLEIQEDDVIILHTDRFSI